MYTIRNKSIKELIIKNSRFITLLYSIHSKDDVKSLLENAQVLYPKATHYTYAYRTLEIEKSSDDGEPSGTAGMPILNVLQKQNIINVLVIVIRYFGGIKLGAGGLVRAYSKACRKTLLDANLIELIPATKVKITTDYKKTKELDHLLLNSTILEKNFTDKIIYTALVEDKSILDDHFPYIILGQGYIEKERS